MIPYLTLATLAPLFFILKHYSKNRCVPAFVQVHMGHGEALKEQHTEIYHTCYL